MRLIVVSTALLLALGGVLAAAASGEDQGGPLPFVGADGTIHFPGRVRDDWVYLGSIRHCCMIFILDQSLSH